MVLGILAHVDAGKTTLSEAMLYSAGVVRTLGRVDKGNAFLDTYALEKQRGITIFSKQAVFQWKNMGITLLDTPGHTDFSAEMERTLQVLDSAILVVSGADGVQGHTKTLWELLGQYNVPVFVFVNKMDMPDTDRLSLLMQLKTQLSSDCIDFTEDSTEIFFEEVSVTSEKIMETYLDTGMVKVNEIAEGIRSRSIFPCIFGSALKVEGVIELLDCIHKYKWRKEYPSEFGARIFKISRDEQGNRLTHLKVTGGRLKTRECIDESGEKINQIRIYSGEKFTVADEVAAGEICAVTGLTQTFSGEHLGIETQINDLILEPVLQYRVILPENTDAAVMLPKLRIIEEEDPMLSVQWNEELQEIQIKIMGEIQLQVLKSIVKDRFNIDIDFDQGNVVYKETISNVVEGVGHFEPLKHYAEVHLRLEPLEAGSGLEFRAECSEDNLGKNWQRLILTHLREKVHKGVLTGSPVTDMRITLVNGRAHLKHTEGGDFRQATYRAVRQGLKMADSVLLEPFYNFRLEIPSNMVGKAMTDIERMYGKVNPPETFGDRSVITGYGPVVTLREYGQDIAAYTKGQGKMSCTLRGYEPCHNADEIIEEMGYDSETDISNPTGSVFCSHGAGFYVSYDEVYQYMHVGNATDKTPIVLQNTKNIGNEREEIWLGTEEIDEIINRTYNSNRKSDEITKKNSWHKSKREQDYFDYKGNKSVNTINEQRQKYLLVDGYNVIFTWDELKELAEVNIDGARGKLMDILCNYQAIKQCELIVVFDAYRVKGHNTEITDYHNIHVVFTKEAETADQYIEKFAHDNGEKYHITVATSDGLEQIIIRGEGCMLISSRELKEEIERVVSRAIEEFHQNNKDTDMKIHMDF